MTPFLQLLEGGGSSPCPHPSVTGNGSFLRHARVQQWHLTLSLLSEINQKANKTTRHLLQAARKKEK